MEDWNKRLEDRNKSELEVLIINNKNLKEKIQKSEDKELVLTFFFQTDSHLSS